MKELNQNNSQTMIQESNNMDLPDHEGWRTLIRRLVRKLAKKEDEE